MDRVNCPLCTGRRTTTSIAFPRVITMKSSRDESLFMRARLYPRLPRPPSSARNLARRYRAGLDSVSFVYSSLPLLFNFIVPWVTASQATKPYYEFHASRVKGPRYSDGAARFCRRRRRRWKICFSDRPGLPISARAGLFTGGWGGKGKQRLTCPRIISRLPLRLELSGLCIFNCDSRRASSIVAVRHSRVLQPVPISLIYLPARPGFLTFFPVPKIRPTLLF